MSPTSPPAGAPSVETSSQVAVGAPIAGGDQERVGCCPTARAGGSAGQGENRPKTVVAVSKRPCCELTV